MMTTYEECIKYNFIAPLKLIFCFYISQDIYQKFSNVDYEEKDMCFVILQTHRYFFNG